MSYVASHLGTVPRVGFAWYLIFLEGGLADPIKEEVDKHFVALGKEIGPKGLVVRGYDPRSFRESVYEAAVFYDPKFQEYAGHFPALLVTNQPPDRILNDAKAFVDGVGFFFPLGRIHKAEGSLVPFLTRLLETLDGPNALESLRSMNALQERKRYWGWLGRYVKLEPSIFGIGVNVDNMLQDVDAR